MLRETEKILGAIDVRLAGAATCFMMLQPAYGVTGTAAGHRRHGPGGLGDGHDVAGEESLQERGRPIMQQRSATFRPMFAFSTPPGFKELI